MRQYEPYFSGNGEYETEPELVETGVYSEAHYDPLGRAFRVDAPDGSFTEVRFGPWQVETWDAGDTVLASRWYRERLSLPEGSPPRDDAERSRVYADTPARAHFDILGRSFLTEQDLGPSPDPEASDDQRWVRTHSTFDVQGNALTITDAEGLVIQRNSYDQLNRVTKAENVDSGTRWALADGASRPRWSWDQRNHTRTQNYDVLQRPTELWISRTADLEHPDRRWLHGLTVYGEAHPNAERQNLRGVPALSFDGAGLVEVARVDFKGAVTHANRRLLRADADPTAESDVDWSALSGADWETTLAEAESLLETERFNTQTEYDAVSRPTIATAPDGSRTRTRYHLGGLLAGVEVTAPESDAWATQLDELTYDAKSQRQAQRHTGSLVTDYSYDPKTFRLVRLRSKRLRDGALLQDLNYRYDAAGNITVIRDGAEQRHFFANQVVTADRTYVYDATGRLIGATGREHAASGPTTHALPAAMGLPHQNDGQAVRRYRQHYRYDRVGNILETRHIAVNGNWTRRYRYDSNSHRLEATSLPGHRDEWFIYDHDSHGNMQSLAHLAGLRWNADDHLGQLDLGGGGWARYKYDSGRQRVRKRVTKGAVVDERVYLGGWERFRRWRGGRLETERSTLHVGDGVGRASLIETLRVADGLVIDSPATLTRTQLGDHLGSVTLEVDDTGQLVSREEYHPYGTVAYRAARAGVEVSAKRYRYTGMERDEESGLQYHSARYLACWLGRWVSADLIGLSGGVNGFAYSSGSPIGRSDVGGLQDRDSSWSADEPWYDDYYVVPVCGSDCGDFESAFPMHLAYPPDIDVVEYLNSLGESKPVFAFWAANMLLEVDEFGRNPIVQLFVVGVAMVVSGGLLAAAGAGLFATVVGVMQMAAGKASIVLTAAEMIASPYHDEETRAAVYQGISDGTSLASGPLPLLGGAAGAAITNDKSGLRVGSLLGGVLEGFALGLALFSESRRAQELAAADGNLIAPDNAGPPVLPRGVGADVEVSTPSRIGENPFAVRQAESMSQQAQRDVDGLLAQFRTGNPDPGLGTRALGNNFFELRGRNAGRVILHRNSPAEYDIVGKFQGHARGSAANSNIIKRLINDYNAQ